MNLYFKCAMLTAILVGMAFDRLVKNKNADIFLLVLHNFIFLICHVAMFFFIKVSGSYTSALIVAMAVGFTYSWNASVSRGVMAKLLPPEKRVKKSRDFVNLYYIRENSWRSFLHSRTWELASYLEFTAFFHLGRYLYCCLHFCYLRLCFCIFYTANLD